jgi:hypothetical protein
MLLLISSEEGEVERWMVAIEQRLPVLPLFQQREVGWRRWSSVAVPLSRKNQQILSLSLKNHWKRSRRKKSLLSSVALPLSTSLSNMDLDKKNEKIPYFIGSRVGPR